MKGYILLLLLFLCVKNGFSQTKADFSDLKPLSHEEFKELGKRDLNRVNKRPYIVKYKHASGGELFYFGSSHTYDPKDKILEKIDSAWLSFKPEVVLWEGGNPDRNSNLPENINEAIIQKGEPGFVRFLANKRGIKDYTLEPSSITVIKELQRGFNDKEILVQVILTQVEQQIRKGASETALDSLVFTYLQRSKIFNFTDVPTDLSSFQKAVDEILPSLNNWKKVKLDMIAPKSLKDSNINVLQKIAATSNEIRDKHMIKLLVTEVKNGKRVFAVVGASHVVIQEPALCQFFGVKYR
ncbi:hypothetical protein [Pedobacter sp. UBA4863]|nr:hypothetical protein [Pedobacter sp. UBA4863]